MFFGLNNFLKKILPKRLFYRALLIIAVPILVLQLIITIVFFDSLWIKTNKGMTRALINEINLFVEIYNNKEIDKKIQTIIEGNYEVSVLGTLGPEGYPFLSKILPMYKNNKIYIFNRWGVSVFESKGYQNNWNGSNNSNSSGNRSSNLPVGTYFYVLDLNGDGSNVKKGYVYLTRMSNE